MTALLKSVESSLEAKDYQKALDSANSYLNDYPNDARAHLLKSVACQRLKKYEEALQSGTLAKQLATKKADKLLVGECDFRLAIIQYNIKLFAEAKQLIDAAVESGYKDPSMELWIQMINNQQKTCSGSTLNNTSPESSKNVSGSSAPVAPRYDFYQTTNSVNVSLFVKNLSKEKTSVHFDSESVDISSELLDGSKFCYCFKPLYGSIHTDTSSFRVFSTKIELSLVKKDLIEWKNVLKVSSGDSGVESGTNTSATTSANTGVASDSSLKEVQERLNKTSISSVYASNKNWDHLLDEEVEEEEKQKAESDPAEFFKEIYKNADADTQRAMMKSYYESNGTSLSTNWDTVGKGKVEMVAPDGMEPKEWK